jgi:hypothetical protein
MNMKMNRTWVLAAAALALASAGCLNSSDGGGDGLDLGALAGTPFCATVNVGGGTGTYSIITGTGAAYRNLAVFNTTDLGVTVHGDAVFVFGRYGQDWLARFDLARPGHPVYQYSTKTGAESSMNPRVVVIADDNTGFVFRYQSDISWIIDPSPADEAGFKLGEIDLSAYATGSAPAYPANPVKALVDGTVMYVVLERTNNWTYDVPAILLTFDISTPASPVITDAHDLIVRSPNQMVQLGTKLYIAGWGIVSWTGKGQHTPAGGIEEVDLSGGVGAYVSTLRVDDDAAGASHDTYGNSYLYDGFTADVAVMSATEGFIYIAEWNDPAVYKVHPFNPATGAVDTATTILDGINLSRIAVGPDGRLWCSASAWYGLGTDAGIYSVAPSAPYAMTGPVGTGLEPTDFAFNE